MLRSLARRIFALRPLTLWSGALLLVVWALENWVGEATDLTAIITYLPQHGWAVLPLLLFILSAFKRRPKLLLLNGLALLFWAKFLWGFCVPLTADRSGSPSVRIVTFNVAQGKFNLQKVNDVIAAQNPDIICLQESQISNDVDTIYSDHVTLKSYPDWKTLRVGDVMIMSRYPLVSSKIHWQREGSTRRILEAVYQTPQGPLRMVNVHVATNFKGGLYLHDSLHTAVKYIIAHASEAAQARMEQIPSIDKAIQSGDTNLPLVMVGDFNTTPRGRFYRHWTSQFTDAFAQSGWGTGVSFPSKLPLLRIDYAFLGNGVRAKRAFVVAGRGSDHLPLVVDAVLP